MRRWLIAALVVGFVGLHPRRTTGDMVWVSNGRPMATVILPDDPYPIAEYAAQELVYHVHQATGVELPVVREHQAAMVQGGRIYVGGSRAATLAGIEHQHLDDEVFVVRGATDDVLYITGRDGDGAPLSDGNIHSGTLWGVYEVVERVLQARWLWPGELGTHVPRTGTVVCPPFDVETAPRFARRRIRSGVSFDGQMARMPETVRAEAQGMGLAFSEAGLALYLHDLHVFLRRHRMGRTSDPRPFTTHAFGNWWDRYGETHPEWFQLLPEGEMAAAWEQRFDRIRGAPFERLTGQRGPADPEQPAQVSMCVSNAALQREIVRRWQEQRAQHPGRVIRLSIGENNLPALCVCAACRALDAPQPTAEEVAAMPRYIRGWPHRPQDAGRRYAIFWQQVHRLAAQVDPDVIVTAFAYMNYITAPEDVTLHPNIVVSFVPWGDWWFPRTPREQQWIREQWRRWRETGATLYSRPNYPWDGGNMPHVYARQMAETIQYEARNGSLAFDFDTLTGQWAVNGTTLYLLHRLMVRPDTPVEELLEEYFLAYGPAAMPVKAYFDYWEAHAASNRLILYDALERHDQASRYTHFQRVAHEMFPASVFDHAESLLDRAAAMAQNGADTRYAQRVEFLRQGLTHARMSAALSALCASQAEPHRIRAHLEALSAFRRSVEHLHIADFTMAAGNELRCFGDLADFDLEPTGTGPILLDWQR